MSSRVQIIAAGLLALAGAAHAQLPRSGAAGRLPFLVLGPDQGLPPTAVVSIAQDGDGYVWMGTENGLVRYENGQHTRWSTEDGLPSSYVGFVLAAPGGGLIISTAKGVGRFRDGRFERLRVNGQPLLDNAAALAVDARGRLWLTTPLGLYRQSTGLEFEQLGWAPERSYALFGAASGTVYLAAASGVRAFLPDGSSKLYGPADGVPAAPTMVVEDGKGRLWAGAGRSLVMKEPGAERFADQSARLLAMLSLKPNSVPLLDRDGSIWLPTQHGALHVDGDRFEFLDAAAGLPFRYVRTLLRDRDGALWVLGPSAARMQGSGRVHNHTLSRDEAGGDLVWHITRARDGRLLVATDDGAGELTASGFQRFAGTEGRRIKALMVDRAGTVWMVNTMGPAFWLRAGESQAVEAPLGPLGSSIALALEDSRGTIWLAHGQQGILRWDPQAQKLAVEIGPEAVGVRSLSASGMREDAQGRVWVGTTAGLFVRDQGGRWNRFTAADGLKNSSVRGMGLAADGTAWVYYDEPVGVSRVRVTGNKLELLEHRGAGQGLRSTLVYEVLPDARGRVWATTDQGLDELTSGLHVGGTDGMASEDCSIHALFAEGDTVWVGTAAGLLRYEAGAPAGRTAPLEARVLQLSAGGERLQPPFALAPLPADDSTVELRVGAPWYGSPRELRFEVRLAGLEEAWRATSAPLVRYPALPPGRYRFEVRAAQGSAPFGPAAAVDLTVLPHWWQRLWARALFAVLAASAVLGLMRLRVASLARSKAALEAEIAARTRELHSRNGELSQALGAVKELSGLLPICMHCHAIRNDSGYWERIEHYISEHTKAHFSHGLCPGCERRHYPEA